MRMHPLAAFAALLTVACSSLPFDPAGPDAAPDPSKPGPFPVGVRTVTIDDPERPDKETGQPRRLVTEVWYPAEESARGGPGATYDVRTLLTDEQKARIDGMAIPLQETTAVRDAPPRTDNRPYPLVIFGHGQGAVRWQSTYYTVVLASHGYVVVAPDHAGSTLYDYLRTKDLAAAQSAVDRPLDFIRVLDWALARPAGDFLSGMIDAAQVGLTGHSFGAYTALAVPPRDARVKAIVPQAPPASALAWIGLERPVILGIPVLIQAGHKDRTLPWDDHIVPTWADLQRPRWLMDLVNAGHFTFSDLCAFDLTTLAKRIDFDVGNTLEDGCGPEAPPPALARAVIDHFAVGFFNATLRGSAGSKALLTQAEADRLGAGQTQITADP